MTCDDCRCAGFHHHTCIQVIRCDCADPANEVSRCENCLADLCSDCRDGMTCCEDYREGNDMENLERILAELAEELESMGMRYTLDLSPRTYNEPAAYDLVREMGGAEMSQAWNDTTGNVRRLKSTDVRRGVNIVRAQYHVPYVAAELEATS